MQSRTSIAPEAGLAALSSHKAAARWRSALAFLGLSAWCGLAAGLLEAGAVVVRKEFFDWNRLYWMSRHFIWLIPLTNLVIFSAVGLLCWPLVRSRREGGRWLARRILATLAIVPVFWAAVPRIHVLAGIVVAMGLAARLVPALERHAAGWRRFVCVSFAPLAAAALVLALSLWVGDLLAGWREAGRPMPPSSSANVLLIVLDTVAARHLGLYGYDRPTSPTLDELAARGIRFERAQATSSWTLPSHASMFTGRWPHELTAGWLTPLDRTFPTLAEFLSAHGYATAGFVANQTYCALDSGLARGFTAYQDYIFPKLTASRAAALVDRPVDELQSLERLLEDWLGWDWLRPAAWNTWLFFKGDRKDAAAVNREFLAWLSSRRQPERPFFAFLNFYDAHSPYQLSRSGIHRFGGRPRNNRDVDLIKDWMSLTNRRPTDRQIALARDSYDDCVADLDEQLGLLIDEVERRGILERTWLIVVADHGESFGEHAGVFRHGTSLYQTEVHVPLVIVPPTASQRKHVVRETVSLRDLPATIVDVLGYSANSPFPGNSLARLWRRSPDHPEDLAAGGPALAEVVPLESFNPDPAQLLKRRWPLAALASDDWTYIRREGEVREELFDAASDSRQTRNLAGDPARQGAIEQMRTALGRLTAGPLTPERFKP
jgi:arylsulfatase A-like enzyme